MDGEAAVAAFYRFVPFPDFAAWRRPLRELMLERGVRGAVLLAPEGVNGAVAGPRAGVDAVLERLRADARFAGLEARRSRAAANPFRRTRVKLKREIVTMGVEGLDPARGAGIHVAPADFDALIDDPEVLLLDVRNRYETAIGAFAGAVDPGTDSFREFPDYAGKNLDPAARRKVAMYCTGGIRCEKASALLKARGFEEVYQLEGGILNYLETAPAEASRWRGECFVFDERVTVNRRLERGGYEQCHACRMPVDGRDMRDARYRKGVSCPHCFDRHPLGRRERFAERERQIALARGRGEEHIGQSAARTIRERRREKLRFKEAQRAREQRGAAPRRARP